MVIPQHSKQPTRPTHTDCRFSMLSSYKTCCPDRVRRTRPAAVNVCRCREIVGCDSAKKDTISVTVRGLASSIRRILSRVTSAMARNTGGRDRSVVFFIVSYIYTHICIYKFREIVKKFRNKFGGFQAQYRYRGQMMSVFTRPTEYGSRFRRRWRLSNKNRSAPVCTPAFSHGFRKNAMMRLSSLSENLNAGLSPDVICRRSSCPFHALCLYAWGRQLSLSPTWSPALCLPGSKSRWRPVPRP